MSSLGTLLDVWEVKDRKETLYFIKHIESRNTNKINEENKQKRKGSKKPKGGGINSADIHR